MRKWHSPLNMNLTGLRLLPFVAAVCFSLLLFFLSYQYDNRYAPQPHIRANGTLKINEDAFAEKPLTFLTGPWAFYQYQLLTPEQLQNGAIAPTRHVSIGQYGGFELDDPEASPHGSATYQLTVYTEPTRQDYALELPEIFSSYHLWINGELKATSGVPGETDQEYQAEIIDSILYFSAAGEIEIVIAVSDYTHFYSGLNTPPAFGSPDQVYRFLSMRLMTHVAYVGITLLIAVFCLAASLLYRFSASGLPLFFLCLCYLGYGSYPLIHTIGLTARFWYDVEWFSRYAMLFACIWLLGRLGKLSPRVYRPLAIAALGISLLVPLYRHFWMNSARDMYLFSRLLTYWQWIAALYLVAGSFYAFKKGRTQSPALLCGFTILACAFLFNRQFPRFEPKLFGWYTDQASFLLILIVFGILLGETAAVYRSNLMLSRKQQQTEERLQMYLSQEQLVEKHAAAIHRLHHERKSTFLKLQLLLEQQDYPQLAVVLQEQLSTTALPQTVLYTPHKLVNAVLLSTAQRASAADIELNIEAGHLPQSLPIKDEDLASLLINALDNALEGCLRLPKEQRRQIEIRLDYQKGLLAIRCTNSAVPTPPAKKRGRFITSKDDKTSHGFGLSIMEQIAHRYDGVFAVEHENGVFSLYIGLPLGLDVP